MRRYIIIILLFSVTQSYSQWKSYYPEGKTLEKGKEKISPEKQQKKFENSLFNALKARALENNEEALNFFQECINIDKKNPLPFYESASINASEGRFIIALEQIKNAVRLEPENRWYLLMYADILFNKQDFLNAATQYKKLINIEPTNEELYFKLSETYIYTNNFKKAIEVYDDLEERKGTDKRLSMQKHNLYRQINDIKGAIDEIIKLLNVFIEDVEAMEILAELYLLNDEKEKAFELFKRIAEISPNNGRIHLTLADYYREKGNNKKSYDELKLAFKSTELTIDTKIRIVASYYQLLSLEEDLRVQAYELSSILIEMYPENIKATLVYADMLYIDKRYHEAEEQYLIALKKDKSQNEVWTQTLFIHAELNNFEGLLKTSKEALEYFPTEPLFYYFNGISNKWFENYEKAILSLITGLEFVIDNEKLVLEFYSSLADVYHKTNQHQLSDEYYEKVLEIDPDNILVLNNYAYFLSVRKIKLGYAKELSFRCNKIEPENGTYQDTYAWILYQLKEYEKAKEWILRAISNGGESSPVIVEHCGDIFYKLGETEEALKKWKQAKELGGSSRFLIQKIEEKTLYE